MDGVIDNHIKVLTQVKYFFLFLCEFGDRRDQFKNEESRLSYIEKKKIFENAFNLWYSMKQPFFNQFRDLEKFLEYMSNNHNNWELTIEDIDEFNSLFHFFLCGSV
jgi:hypothetical protein